MPAPQSRAASRAERWYPVWLVCGVLEERRSPAAALRVGAMMRLEAKPPSLKTIARWRSAYNWVERADEFDREHTLRTEGVLLADAIADDVRQAKLGKALQTLALEGAGVLKVADLNGTQIARLAEAGFKIERLVSGEATEIHAFMASTYNMLSLSLAPLFGQAAEAGFAELLRHIPAENREAAIEAARYRSGEVWGPGVNRVAREHFRALGTEVVIEEPL